VPHLLSSDVAKAVFVGPRLVGNLFISKFISHLVISCFVLGSDESFLRYFNCFSSPSFKLFFARFKFGINSQRVSNDTRLGGTIVSLFQLFLVSFHVQSLELPHLLDLVEVDHKALFVDVVVLDALSAEHTLVV